jgi:flagellar basal-body rod modification protein FlgD
MPGIGRPEQANAFGRISMAPKNAKKNKASKEEVGETLNRLAGAENTSAGVKYADRKTHNKLGKDGFLKLLSHQLQNQDPMKPADQKQFAADLAQFSQLEQLSNLNTKFDKMDANAPQESKFYGASFLGKEIMTKGATISYDGETTQTDIPFYLEKPAKNVVVNIFDSRRQLVGQLEAEELGRGQQNLVWNGKQLDGQRATKDEYTVQVRAFDREMNPFKGETKATGVVTGVNFENGETVLTLSNGKQVFLRDVDSFKLPSQEKANKQNNVTQQNMHGLKKAAAQSYNDINESM